ncbi:uncharacterized protein LOC124263346 [Haliotis rubra]|uniref:uncharacterized protein LOC124263346 n=1 Tax=Haliotis rubra TaxID=36100 RepID=UPI001EE55065|nr:uncharacterized protein LOC124263346 [Haliotis rubra]
MAEEQLLDFGKGIADVPGALDVISEYFCTDDNNASNNDVLEDFAETCLDSSLCTPPEYGEDTVNVSELDVDRDVVEVTLPTLSIPLSHSDCELEVQSFIESGCCAWNCTKKFPLDMIQESRLDCLEFDFYCDNHVNHHHILMLGALNTLVQNQPHTVKKGHAPQPRKETRTTYMFRGVTVCREFFMFVFGSGIKRLKNVKEHMLVSGINAKKHGRADKTNQSTCLTLEQRKKAVQFIENYGEQNALVMPGRISGRKNTDLKLLPSHMTKKLVYGKYEDACHDTDEEPVSVHTWYATWMLFCSHIVIQRPRTDLCAVCQQNSMTMSKLKTFCDNKKRELAKRVVEHIDQVTSERGFYISIIDECRQDVELLTPRTDPFAPSATDIQR